MRRANSYKAQKKGCYKLIGCKLNFSTAGGVFIRQSILKVSTSISLGFGPVIGVGWRFSSDQGFDR